MKNKYRKGYDYDGLLNRVPLPFALYLRNLRRNDCLERAGLEWIRRIITRVAVHLPTVLDKRVVDRIEPPSYIISGRTHGLRGIIPKLEKLGFQGIHFRQGTLLPEVEFKYLMCKQLKIDIYYDDCLYIVEELRKRGIDARDAREILHETRKETHYLGRDVKVWRRGEKHGIEER